jgi:hypothetical protein
MKELTNKLKKIKKSKTNQKLLYKKSNKRAIRIFVDDLSIK